MDDIATADPQTTNLRKNHTERFSYRMRNPSESSILIAMALFLLFLVYLGTRSRSPSYSYHHEYHYYPAKVIYYSYPSEQPSSSDMGFIFVVLVGVFSVLVLAYHQYLGKKVSFLIVQVGLPGKDDTVQRELDEISNPTNTSSLKLPHAILQESVSVLLQHSASFISGHARVEEPMIEESVVESFKELVSDERAKFNIASPVNVNNVKIRRPLKDYIVVTFLLAAKGTYEVPTIRSTEDMKAALTSLYISCGKFMAAEVLWRNDTLSEEQLLETTRF